ncbi:ABC transporter ATP-binding protein [Jannaschia sp. 2305UL9-9]|uniref:ABC transporter ATP-binding protein n=1 Tax=Jannaschia sp. 2305UL9-9 TaxID=3121638 RepID=UPI003527C69A
MKILEAIDLRKAYGALQVTNDVNFSVDAGEVLGIIGPNGAGKSTAFGLIAGAIPTDAGSVWLDGRDVTRLGAASRCRAGIGRTYQIPRPFGGLTVYENVLLAAQAGGGDPNAVPDVLRRLGLAALAGQRAGTLRLLDRKRLEMARAMATAPQVLLLDEVAGGLTEPECAVLIETVRELRGDGLGIVWIEHVVGALLAVADRLLVLDQGRVLAEGEPQATFHAPEVRSVYMGIAA